MKSVAIALKNKPHLNKSLEVNEIKKY